MHIGIFRNRIRSWRLWAACSWVFVALFLAAMVFAQDPPTETDATETETDAEEQPEEAAPVESMTAQEPAPEPVMPGITEPEKTSWLGFLVKGGLTMIPILVCSVGFIAIVAVKIPIFRLMRFRINIFAETLRTDVSAGNIDDAIEKCEQSNNAITRPLMKGLSTYKNDPDRTEDELREAMLDEMPGLESYIGWLGIIAGVAPLLGLFGTVVGIIQAFIQLAAGGAVTDPSSFTLLADGIYKALITTAAGLFVGIPALVMYEYFRMKVSDLMRDMDRVSVSLLNALGIGLGGQE